MICRCAVFVLSLMMWCGMPAWGQASGAGTQPAGETVYADPTGMSSANVTQVLPNSAQTMLTLANVERVELRQETFIIHWAHGAVTLLPRQFVTAITINRRQVPSPASAPAAP